MAAKRKTDAGKSRQSGARNSPAGGSQPSSSQFSIASLMWTLACVAVTLGYLRGFGLQSMIIGAEAFGLAVVIGALLGLPARRVGLCIFWAVLGAAFAYLCVVGGTRVRPFLLYAWPIAGAVGGAITAIASPHYLRAILLAGGAGAAVMAAFYTTFAPVDLEMGLDVAAAFIAVAGLAGVIEIMQWLQRRKSYKAHIVATGLIVTVTLANMIADVLLRQFGLT